MRVPFLFCALLATATGALAQKPEGRSDARADAKADARADASGKSSDSSHTSHTSTHRVVVENGRTIVDERTEDGRVVPSGGGAGGALPGGMPLPGGLPSLKVAEIFTLAGFVNGWAGEAVPQQQAGHARVRKRRLRVGGGQLLKRAFGRREGGLLL